MIYEYAYIIIMHVRDEYVLVVDKLMMEGRVLFTNNVMMAGGGGGAVS